MKVYFTCSTADLLKYRDDYFHIRNYLISQGHVLTRDWLPHTEKKLLSGDIDIRDMKDLYKACIQSIKDADLVIVEDTVSNFSTGHQITIALQQRKPTLVLWQGKKHRKFKQMFIHGVESPLLQVSEYTLEELDNIIHKFIKKFELINETNRFHLVLSGVERQYLDWAQFTKHKSRTKVIKEGVQRLMEEDAAYAEYLSD